MTAPGPLFEAWQSGRTVRKHTMHVHRRENTAEHTWGMLLLLYKYVRQPSPELVRYITLHDAGEQGAADIPAHLCWSMPELKQAVQAREDQHVQRIMQGPHTYAAPQLSQLELDVAEVLDRAEFVLSCWYEFQMGNRLVVNAIVRATVKLAETLQGLPQGNPTPATLKTFTETCCGSPRRRSANNGAAQWKKTT